MTCVIFDGNYSRYVQVCEREKGPFVITAALAEVRLIIKRVRIVMCYLSRKEYLLLRLVVGVYEDCL